ncbi:peroxidasin homolog pxn-2-like [Ixodes scapularis]
MRSFQLALLFFLACSASATPACVETYGSTRTIYTCSGFTTHEDFDRYVNRDFPPHQYPDITFVLKDSTIDYIPPSAFIDTRASTLVFNNVQVSSLPEVGQGVHPFHGVSSWLKRIEYRNGSSVPGTWRLLQPLTKLQALVFRNMPHLQLTEDFNSLPLNLKKIDIENSTIRSVRSAWLSQLTNLEELVVKGTNLNIFERSMLPSPATKLTSLDLRHNELTSLPEDLTRDAPSLRTLNVASNKIRSFNEESFQQLKENQNATVNLEGNPLKCDCHARFLSSVPDSWRSPPCESPERLRGRQVKQIGISQLLCD